MVAKTFPSNVPENINLAILQLGILDKRKEILYKVKNYIDNQLNLAKMNLFDKSKDNFLGLKSILVLEVLEELGIKEEYERVLKISDDQDFQLHLKRPNDSCFVSNYLVRVYLHGK